MYQGICIANCESNATQSPQRNMYRTLSLELKEITNGYGYSCQCEMKQNRKETKDGVILAKLNFPKYHYGEM